MKTKLTSKESDWVDYMVNMVYDEVISGRPRPKLLSIDELALLGGFEYVRNMQYTWAARIKFTQDEMYLLNQAITNEIDRLGYGVILEKWDRTEYLREDIADLERLHRVYFLYHERD